MLCKVVFSRHSKVLSIFFFAVVLMPFVFLIFSYCMHMLCGFFALCIAIFYSGCCAFGEDCPVVCNDPGAAATAGCVFPPPTESPTDVPSTEPSSQPTDRPSAEPSVEPTDFPSTEPTAAPFSIPPTIDFSGQCQIRVNSDKCENYTPAQPVVEGCDCYNYCGVAYL